MNQQTELVQRTEWSLALIGELVNAGRKAGWLPGKPLVAGDSLSEVALASPPSPATSAMSLLAARLQLSNTEMDLLWLLACIELDPCVARASDLLLAPGSQEMTVQIAERLVGRGSPIGRDIIKHLHELALIHASSAAHTPLHRRSIRVHDRVLDLALDEVALDRNLSGVAALDDVFAVRRYSKDSHDELPPVFRQLFAESDPVLVVASGLQGSGRSTLLRHAIASHGRLAIAVQCRELSVEGDTFASQLRAIGRECRLHNALPILIEADPIADRLAAVDRELLKPLSVPVFATTRDACPWSVSRPVVNIAIELPNANTREEIWQRSLPNASAQVISDCAARYAITPGMISRAASTALSLAGDSADVEHAHVHAALRSQLERQLLGVARRIETRQTWNDLVLPVDQFDLLIEMVARVRHKQRVLDDWGFAEKIGRGLGLSALFSGPPGTGKTMIAGLMAQELGLDLYQVDLSKVVSKYIGETEKQLAALFEAAESGHAILLFDEADSLFAKRTEVKSSNDRYANLEVNYLLQRIEAFSGITILTTNHETAIDQAFLRRLAFHVRVPMPEEREREMLWRSMIPSKAACASDVDYAGLARSFEMSGGYIKNAALRAAFLCAEEGGHITNEQLWRAARAEYEGMGKISYAPTRRLG